VVGRLGQRCGWTGWFFGAYMTKFLPPALLALFAPRPPLPFKPPVKRRRPKRITGLAPYVAEFEDPSQREEPLSAKFTLFEKPPERAVRKRKERAEKREMELELEAAKWNPESNPNATGDAFKTLFVARLPYDANERDIEKEFDGYGKIRAVKLVKHAKTQKSRGYAFVEYDSTSAMREAYKKGDGTRVKGRRALVDVERGRTIEGWKPRRLGGGLGKTRAAKEKKDKTRARSRSRDHHGSSSSSSRKRSRSRERDRDRDRDRGRGGGRGRSRSRSRDGDRRRRDWR